MKREYKIMDIRDGQDSRFGNIIVVKANEVSDTGYGKSYTSNIYENTVTFYFPSRNNILNELISIAKSEDFWSPDVETEFILRTVRDEETGDIKRVYRHVSFYAGDKQSFDLDVNADIIIANRQQKIEDLFLQYNDNHWNETYSFADYVRSLADDDIHTHFWRWLFETAEFDGKNAYQLPPKHCEAYIDFTLSCEKHIDIIPF